MALKEIATAAALAALRKKYDRPAKATKAQEPNEETGRLIDSLNSAKLSLSQGIDRLVARAGKGGASNAELIKTTAKLKELAKAMG